MKLMGHADFSTTQKYYIFITDERKKQEYEQAWRIGNNSTENNNNDIVDSSEHERLMKKFEELQKMWLKTLVASTILQKNNTH